MKDAQRSAQLIGRLIDLQLPAERANPLERVLVGFSSFGYEGPTSCRRNQGEELGARMQWVCDWSGNIGVQGQHPFPNRLQSF